MDLLVSIDEAKEFLPGGEAAALRPENERMFGSILRAAQRTIFNRSMRNFVVEPAFVGTGDDAEDTATPVTKTFRVDRNGSARIPDLRALTGITYGGLTVTSDAYELTATPNDEYPFVFADLLFYSGAITPYVTKPVLAITGRWGITPVPDDIKVAIFMTAARMFAKREARWADQVQAGLEGSAFNYYSKLPDEIKGPIEALRVRKIALI